MHSTTRNWMHTVACVMLHILRNGALLENHWFNIEFDDLLLLWYSHAIEDALFGSRCISRESNL